MSSCTTWASHGRQQRTVQHVTGAPLHKAQHWVGNGRCNAEAQSPSLRAGHGRMRYGGDMAVKLMLATGKMTQAMLNYQAYFNAGACRAIPSRSERASEKRESRSTWPCQTQRLEETDLDWGPHFMKPSGADVAVQSARKRRPGSLLP